MLPERTGRNNELSGDIHPSREHVREHGIDEDLLDKAMGGMDLSPDERGRAAQAVWEWM